MTDTTKMLAAIIPHGHANAIPRRTLSARLGMTDRGMRQAVEDARNDGLLIANDGDGEGYYQATSVDEMMRQYRQDTARAMAILKRRKTLRNMLKAAGQEV